MRRFAGHAHAQPSVLADAGRIGVVAPGHLVARLGPAAAEDPATARGAAVVAQLREAGELLAGLAHDLASDPSDR